MYHFVWMPKYQNKVFKEPYRAVLKDIIHKIAYDYEIGIVELDVSVDHIHRVVNYGRRAIFQKRLEILAKK